jgi:hypothetical protein
MVYGYIMKAAETGNYKVGVTSRLKQRLASYRTHSGENLSIEFFTEFENRDFARGWERAVLERFAAEWIRGEWIKGSSRLRDEIKTGVVLGSKSIAVTPEHRSKSGYRLTVRFPTDLMERMKQEVMIRSVVRPSYCLCDLVIDAMMEYLEPIATEDEWRRISIEYLGELYT